MKGLFQCPPRAAPWVMMDASLSPCKGKSLQSPSNNKAFALTGRLADCYVYPGRCPGLGASGPSART